MIIGMLAAVAIPACQDFVSRSRVAEGLGLSPGARQVAPGKVASGDAGPGLHVELMCLTVLPATLRVMPLSNGNRAAHGLVAHACRTHGLYLRTIYKSAVVA